MRPSIAASLALGLLGADLAAGSVCRPRLSSSVSDVSLTTSSETTYTSLSASSTATESFSTSTSISVESSETAQSTSETSSSATLSTSTTISAESVSTSSFEVVSESTTTLVTRTGTAESASTSSSEVASESSSTTAESTTASTTIESFTTQTTTTESSTIVESSTTADSSTALTTTTEPATTDSSTTQSSTVSSTSSAPFVNPTFYFQVNGGNLDDELVKNNPAFSAAGSRLRPSDTTFVPTPAYVEEGTGRLRTLFNNYYLCIRGQYGLQAGNFLPADVVLCNTEVGSQADVNRYQYLTCQLTGSNGISCSAQGITCLRTPGPRADTTRCDMAPDTPFTQFFTSLISATQGYHLHLGPQRSFAGYETVELERKAVQQS